MISRIWRGWTSQANADAYQTLLQEKILPGIAARRIGGYAGAHLLRRDLESEVEFVTILWFASMGSVRAFAGEEHELAVVPPEARALLSRFDARSAHYRTVLTPDNATADQREASEPPPDSAADPSSRR